MAFKLVALTTMAEATACRALQATRKGMPGLTSLATTAKAAGLTPSQAGHVGAAQATTLTEAYRLVAVDACGGKVAAWTTANAGGPEAASGELKALVAIARAVVAAANP